VFRFRVSPCPGFPVGASVPAYPVLRLTPPSSNRTCGFPASGSPDCCRRGAYGAAPFHSPFLCWPSLCLTPEPLVRKGSHLQAELRRSYEAHNRSGPLAPRALPRFLATMSRSETRRPARRIVMHSDPPRPNRALGCRGGPPRFLDRSIRARCPQPPRRAP